MDDIRSLMEWAAFALDILAVVAIVLGAVIAAFRRNLLRVVFRLDETESVSGYRRELVNGLLLGLDLLVASDVIKTAALDYTLYNMATLGILVLVRILLTWSLVVETEGRWPWQPRAQAEAGDPADAGGRS
jgi:uncharacterized membrane protein